MRPAIPDALKRAGALRQALRRGTLGVGVALLAMAACHQASASEDPEPDASAQPVTLIVRNHGFYDVDVFVLRSQTGGDALRVGMVPGSGTASLPIQARHLQPGRVLVVRVHAIGTSSTWTSRPITLDLGDAAELDINMDANGRMTRSVLAPRNAPPGAVTSPASAAGAGIG